MASTSTTASTSSTPVSLIALLDLPKHSRVSLDGQTIVLQTNDFVGISNLHSPKHFHLVTASPGGTADNSAAAVSSSLTVGFISFQEDCVRLIRRYNPQTEEVAADPVDSITVGNLVSQLERNQIGPTRVLDYSQVVVSSQQESLNQQVQWQQQTKYLNESNILRLRGLRSGDKIVPGCYNPDDDLQLSATNTASGATANLRKQDAIIDGKSIHYPPVPVIDSNVSLSSHKHAGTKRYLATLEPKDRTQLFLHRQSQGQAVLQKVLHEYYQSSWKALLGDLQLSYCLFLYLQCFASLEHWKDLLAMLALSTMTDNSSSCYTDLYRGLLEVLPYQLSSMDPGFLEDLDEAGGNFLLPSLERLQRNLCWGENAICDTNVTNKFQHILVNKFPQTFSESSLRIEELRNEPFNCDMAMEDDDYNDDDDVDDEDGPVMVSADEIEASLARSSAAPVVATALGGRNSVPSDIQKKYPILMAAIMPHEDILMTCARALDEKTDVSLVREAASYLESVEQYKQF
jgi:A1 cistron-splicing factor AAR2